MKATGSAADRPARRLGDRAVLVAYPPILVAAGFTGSLLDGAGRWVYLAVMAFLGILAVDVHVMTYAGRAERRARAEAREALMQALGDTRDDG